MKRIITLAFLALIEVNSNTQIKKQILDYEFEGVVLNGVLKFTKNHKPKGIVLIVYGFSQTDAVAQE
jgi:hypothetical protein